MEEIRGNSTRGLSLLTFYYSPRANVLQSDVFHRVSSDWALYRSVSKKSWIFAGCVPEITESPLMFSTVKLENQESGFSAGIFCQFEAIEEFPRIVRSPNILRRWSESYRNHPNIPQNIRTAEDVPKIFRLICMIIRGLPNNPKSPMNIQTAVDCEPSLFFLQLGLKKERLLVV